MTARLITASKVSPTEFLNAVIGPRECEEMRRVRFLMHSGREDEAKALLDALNRIQRAFGYPEYPLPDPLAAAVERGLRFTLELQAKARAA